MPANRRRSLLGELLRELERDLLIELLAWAAGSVDAWSFFGAGHVFTANMTGNTVLLGVALAHAGDGRIAGPAIAIIFYAVGVIAAGLLSGEEKPCGELWPRRVSWVLTSETLLLAVTCWLWIFHYPAITAPTRRLMIGVAAAALGMQSGAMQRLGIPGIVTTYITGTWTTLMNNITRLLLKKPPASAPRSVKRWEERIAMQGGVFLCYLLGAAATGWSLRFAAAAAPVIPTACVLLAAAYGQVRGGRRPGNSPRT